MGMIKNIAARYGYVPKQAMDKAEKKLDYLRRFNAAKVDRLVSSWVTEPTTIDADLRYALETCVARARDLAKNNDYMRSFLRDCRTNVVGAHGFTLQSKPPSSFSEGIDTAAARAIEAAWLRYRKYGQCDTTGTMTGTGIENLLLTHLMRDGEYFVIEHRGWQGNADRYAVQILDPMLIDPDLNRQYPGGMIRMGVEFDGNRRPVAYHVKVKADRSDGVYIHGVTHERVTADRVMHRFIPEYSWQTRGFPPAVSAMLRLQMVDGYEEAAIVGARMGASQVMNLVDPEDGQGYTGDGTQDAGGDYQLSNEPGAINRLPAGTELLGWKPDYPNVEYGQFVKATLRGVAAGLGTMYNSLAGDLESVNFSSLRMGALWERDVWMCLQQFQIEHFENVWFENWLDTSLIAGNIRIGNNPLRIDDANVQRYKTYRFQGRRWPWVDPLKDIQANVLAWKSNQISMSQIIRDQGRDPEDVYAEIAAEQQTWADLGITPEAIGIAMNLTGEADNE